MIRVTVPGIVSPVIVKDPVPEAALVQPAEPVLSQPLPVFGTVTQTHEVFVKVPAVAVALSAGIVTNTSV